jgi:hypothetical protein
VSATEVSTRNGRIFGFDLCLISGCWHARKFFQPSGVENVSVYAPAVAARGTGRRPHRRGAPGDVEGEFTVNRQSIPALRRVGLAAGVAVTAALGAGAAAGATAPAAQAAAVATCATSQLKVWYGEPGGAAAGSSYLPLEFSNIGTTTCALDGFPGVSGVSDTGAQLGTSASWNHVIAPSDVVLSPGATAHVVLQIVDVYNYPPTTCKPTQASGLRVYPPNQTASVVVPFVFEACASTGPVYLNVDPVNAGVGIPAYSNT